MPQQEGYAIGIGGHEDALLRDTAIGFWSEPTIET
jgi:hypothetical protein